MASKTAKFRAGVTLVLIGVSVFVAGCGSSSSSSSTAAAAAAPTASQTVSRVSSTHVVIATAQGPGGLHLTGASGRALYLWMADRNGKSSCSGACAMAWPPLVTRTKPAAGPGTKASDLGTIVRSGGSEQVTYKGHPLYYFVGDTAAATTSGQGSDGFGAKWWLISSSGSAITASAARAPASSGSSGTTSSSAGGGSGY